MQDGISRRVVLALMGMLAAPGWAKGDVAGQLAALERKSGGRLGVAAHDPATGETVGHRMDERFGMCSTCKLPLAALLFREADAGRVDLERAIVLTAADREDYAPVAGPKIGGTMTIRALMHAAQTTSDNMATNLLLREIGGPAGYTAKLRALGDGVTRMDRLEPAMNFVPKGEVRDTTSPRAMAMLVGRFLEGGLLRPESRDELVGWMVETRTGANRLRAGLPDGWKAGDKTGTGNGAGMVAKYNDVAAIWPPAGRRAVMVAAYFDAAAPAEERNAKDEAVLADAGRVLVPWM